MREISESMNSLAGQQEKVKHELFDACVCVQPAGKNDKLVKCE